MVLSSRYANLGDIAHRALERYCKEVESGEFPSLEFSPYAVKPSERDTLAQRLRQRGHAEAADTLESFAPTKAL